MKRKVPLKCKCRGTGKLPRKLSAAQKLADTDLCLGCCGTGTYETSARKRARFLRERTQAARLLRPNTIDSVPDSEFDMAITLALMDRITREHIRKLEERLEWEALTTRSRND